MSTLKFTILNAQLVTCEKKIEIDGEPAVARFKRTAIEAIPEDETGKTFSAILPADAIDEFVEGASITITIAVDAAQPEA